MRGIHLSFVKRTFYLWGEESREESPSPLPPPSRHLAQGGLHMPPLHASGTKHSLAPFPRGEPDSLLFPSGGETGSTQKNCRSSLFDSHPPSYHPGDGRAFPHRLFEDTSRKRSSCRDFPFLGVTTFPACGKPSGPGELSPIPRARRLLLGDPLDCDTSGGHGKRDGAPGGDHARSAPLHGP